MDSKLRIAYLFGGASIILGLVVVFDILLAPGASAGQAATAELYRSATVAGICAAIEAAVAVLLVCFETRARKVAIIPMVFALLFAWSAAQHYREGRTSLPPAAGADAASP